MVRFGEILLEKNISSALKQLELKIGLQYLPHGDNGTNTKGEDWDNGRGKSIL